MHHKGMLVKIMIACAIWSFLFTWNLGKARRDASTAWAESIMPDAPTPEPVSVNHFPDRLHAYVWRNWPLVPTRRLAETIGATPAQILQLGKSMGLPDPPTVSDDQWRRSYVTIIRRNWHLLPTEQLCSLLGWTPAKLAFALREDDFLFHKLGGLIPRCETLRFAAPEAAAAARERAIAQLVQKEFPDLAAPAQDPLFGFVRQLSAPPEAAAPPAEKSMFSPRYCYSYFALYGDPLLEAEADPFPDGYLARLAQSGVDGVWLQAVLFKLTPFPWDPQISEHWQERLARLGELVARAKRHGIGIYLYFNEPRSMPLPFFEKHPELKGAPADGYASLCTSVPAVRDYLRNGVAAICTAVPDLAGIFTITASENRTHCWSHGKGINCPRCASRKLAEVIDEVITTLGEGIEKAKAQTRLIAWDWGWNDDWAPAAIAGLPKSAAFMSLSELSLPIERGGVKSKVDEYSISSIGPGPRATRHWELARQRGLATVAKIQANNTWELSIVPYIPAVENVAQHAANLRQAGINGLMLSWTLGGYPSPNLEVVAELGRSKTMTPQGAMARVAGRRFGADLAPAMVKAWQACSRAFSEYPLRLRLGLRGPATDGAGQPVVGGAHGLQGDDDRHPV